MTITGGILRCLAAPTPAAMATKLDTVSLPSGELGLLSSADRHVRRRVVGGTVYEDAKGRRHEVIGAPYEHGRNLGLCAPQRVNADQALPLGRAARGSKLTPTEGDDPEAMRSREAI
jgi:hypothetical protein